MSGSSGSTFDHLGCHIRIAVAVTTDPGSRPYYRLVEQFGIRPPAAQRVPHRGVDLGDHLEE